MDDLETGLIILGSIVVFSGCFGILYLLNCFTRKTYTIIHQNL